VLRSGRRQHAAGRRDGRATDQPAQRRQRGGAGASLVQADGTGTSGRRGGKEGGAALETERRGGVVGGGSGRRRSRSTECKSSARVARRRRHSGSAAQHGERSLAAARDSPRLGRRHAASGSTAPQQGSHAGCKPAPGAGSLRPAARLALSPSQLNVCDAVQLLQSQCS
jgi:hypothetical protein